MIPCAAKTRQGEAQGHMERLSMRKIKEVIRLKQEQRLANRAIARSYSISRSTVADYLRRAEAAGLRWPLPEKLSLFLAYLPGPFPSISQPIHYPLKSS